PAAVPTPQADATELPQAEPQSQAPQRDAQGRFTAGNYGGPGNPFARRVAAVRQAFFDAVSDADLREMVQATVQPAKKGNCQAANLFFAYPLGKPAPAAEPDRLDADEWARYHETAKMIRETPYLITGGEPSLPLDMVRLMRPVESLKHQRTFLDMMN